jgi:2-polyprenyl-6-methoxyphenol hydroxylase-like FAD-dependent oxidoreductase
VPYRGGAIRTSGGDTLFDVAAPEVLPDGRWLGAMIHRADLLAVLAGAVGADGIRTGAEVTGVESRGERVVARLADGSEVAGDVLIGADGIRSTVRRDILGEVAPRYAGYTIWRWVAPFPGSRLRPGESWGAGARFGQAALPGERAYAYATLSTPAGGRGAAGERRELERVFSGWHAPIPDLVAAAPEAAILRNDSYDLPPLRAWGRGRVTLLGDAAHAMTPNLGQGACQALEDAVALSEWLRDAPDVERALRGYETQRRRPTASFQRRSRSAGAVGQWRHPLALLARRVLARTVLSRLSEREMRAIAADASGGRGSA